MPTSDRSLELAARLVAALHAATRGRLGHFRSISDIAERAGISGSDIERAVATAERAGFVDRHVDRPMIVLTPKGIAAARPA